MKAGEYREAMGTFQSSGTIWKALDGPTHLSVGRALDAYGLAALQHPTKAGALVPAKRALEKASAIRFHTLGAWHIDTVETYKVDCCVFFPIWCDLVRWFFSLSRDSAPGVFSGVTPRARIRWKNYLGLKK